MQNMLNFKLTDPMSVGPYIPVHKRDGTVKSISTSAV